MFWKFLQLCIEAYELAALPPALDYSKNVDITYRDDLTRRSRERLLQLGIDAKSIVNGILNDLPENRSKILHGWIMGGWNYYDELSHINEFNRRHYLKKDIDRLKIAFREGFKT